MWLSRFFILAMVAAAPSMAQAPPSVASSIGRNLADINRKILEMAQDFPEDKYGYRLTKDQRTFGELIVHIASGNEFGSKFGKGEKVEWTELDAKDYKTKASIVALFQKSMADCDATLKLFPEGEGKTTRPWIGVIEHSAEHYGLLVAYYRMNGMVPPESRPKAK